MDSGKGISALYKRLSDGMLFSVRSPEYKAARDGGLIDGVTPKPKDATATVKRPKVQRPRDPEAKAAFKEASRAVVAMEYGVILGAFFNTFAVASSQPHWALTDTEEKRMGDAIAGVVPQLPAGVSKRLSKASPWIKLALVSSQVIGPRVIMSQAVVTARRNAPPGVDPKTITVPTPTNVPPAETNVEIVIPVPEKAVNL